MNYERSRPAKDSYEITTAKKKVAKDISARYGSTLKSATAGSTLKSKTGRFNFSSTYQMPGKSPRQRGVYTRTVLQTPHAHLMSSCSTANVALDRPLDGLMEELQSELQSEFAIIEENPSLAKPRRK